MSRHDQVGAHKTSTYCRDGMTRVRYHSTEVVSFNNKSIILNTGGWFTSTT